jgi:hypothetical protein
MRSKTRNVKPSAAVSMTQKRVALRDVRARLAELHDEDMAMSSAVLEVFEASRKKTEAAYGRGGVPTVAMCEAQGMSEEDVEAARAAIAEYYRDRRLILKKTVHRFALCMGMCSVMGGVAKETVAGRRKKLVESDGL